ncbi:hypothetical protein ABW20_dc0100846 [Dactylellina cionopaga]|nr:hypothetical protein ABW20_dc0100846 [Dactylellina cionopaga]
MSQGTYRPLQGKLAIVTGASRGIGAAISEKLASYGANLVLNYTSESSSSKTADVAKALAEKYGTQSVIVRADMSDPNVGDIIIEGIKGSPLYSQSTKPLVIDIVINNAG